MRGSIAGITYLTTPSGAIIARQRVIPSDPPSPLRTAAKSALIQTVADWQALTTAQRLAWQVWAVANGTLSGREEFMAANCFQQFGIISTPTGWPVINDVNTAPVVSGHTSITFTNVPYTVALNTGVAFQVQNTSSWEIVAMVELSPALTTARNYWKGPWVPGATIASAIATGVKKKFEFGGLTAGQRYFARARAIGNSVVPPAIPAVISPPLITYGLGVTNP